MKYCDDLPEFDGMPCCCEECHEDGFVFAKDFVIEYNGEEYSVCCRVGNFIDRLAGEVSAVNRTDMDSDGGCVKQSDN